MSKPENPIKDIAQNLNIGNSVLDNVDKGIVDLKKILEDLLNAKWETPNIFPLFETLRDLIKF